MLDQSSLNDFLGLTPWKKKDDSPASLNYREKAIILLFLEGKKAECIAEELHCSSGKVYSTLRSAPAKALISDYLSFADQEFQSLYKLSIEAVRHGLEAGTTSERLKAAQIYLRAHGKESPKETTKDKVSAEDVIQMLLDRVNGTSAGTQVSVREAVRETSLQLGPAPPSDCLKIEHIDDTKKTGDEDDQDDEAN